MNKKKQDFLHQLGSELHDQMQIIMTLKNTLDLLSHSELNTGIAGEMTAPYHELLKRTTEKLDDIAYNLLETDEWAGRE